MNPIRGQAAHRRFCPAENIPTRSCAGVIAVVDDDGPVDHHVRHAFGVLLRLLIRSRVRDRIGIENHDVSPINYEKSAVRSQDVNPFQLTLHRVVQPLIAGPKGATLLLR
jgi:hypothetical protein